MRLQLENSGFKQQQLRVIRNALVIEHYQVGIVDDSFRKRLGLKEDSVLIANIGRLSPEKGQDLFIKAAQKIVPKYRNVYFTLIGIGPKEAELKMLSKMLGIETNVIFAGYQKDMLSVYRSLDLVVQCSHTEGMPNVIMESLLMEVPVLATEVGGTIELLEPESVGTLIEPDRLDLLIKGIETYLQNQKAHKAMAIRGRQFISENFNHQNRLAKLMDVYEEVISTH